jgi:tRNA-splicing ligase RtcB
VQQVVKIFDSAAASVLRIHVREVVVSIHCESRGLGHQIGTEFLKDMAVSAADSGIDLPDREWLALPSTQK